MTIQTFNFASSALDTGSYDDETGELVITMMTGAEIVKEDIDPQLWERLKNAPSPGQFFNAEIRGR